MTSASERFSASTERGPAADRGRFRWLAPAVCALAVALAAVPQARGIEEEDIAGQLAAYSQLLQEATEHLQALDFAEAIDAYGKILDAYKTGKIPMVTPDAQGMVEKSYEGRAMAFANLGKNAEASTDFESLIRLDPSYQVDLSGVSPKIVKLYTDVRKKTVGVISVETDPLGAEVALGGQPLGPAPVTDREVVAGAYKLTIAKPGFDPVEEEIEVEAGGRIERQIKLVPNARGIRLATVPRDVKVLVDGQERGATFGTAGPEFQQVADEMGLSLADVSEPLLVENLPPGDHEVLLRKECYQEVSVPISIEVDPNNNAPVTYKPFVLEPSRGGISVVSEPPGAKVFLDGSPQGEAPLELKGICSGKHDLRLEQEGLGRYSGTVTVAKDSTVTATHRLRLSLAAFDLREGIGEADGLGARLREQGTYNVLDAPPALPGEVSDRVRLEIQSSPTKRLAASTVSDLRSRLAVEMLAVVIPSGTLGTQADFLLYGPAHEMPDVWRMEGQGGSALDPVVAAMGAKVPSTAPWTGLELIDLYGERHPVVLAIQPESPATKAGIEPGDAVVTVADAPIGSTADFLAAIGRARAGQPLSIGIERGGVPKQAEVKCGATPVVLPSKATGILYNKAITDLRQAAALAPDPESRSYVLLSMARAFMHFGLWETAVRECLRKVVLPEGPGISRGTAAYLTAICFEKLKLDADARSSYESAAESKDATLHTNDGPRVAPSARRRAAALGASK